MIHSNCKASYHFHPQLALGQGGKISLKNYNKGLYLSKHTQSTTTCNSVCRPYEKKSLKEFITVSKIKPLSSNNFTCLKYQDIRCNQPNQKKVFANLFCFQKKQSQQQGCKCEPKCLWINYWLSLSCNMQNNIQLFAITEQTEQQIKKDILRTQPGCKQFQKLCYQQALYQCLVNYARVDRQIGYVQGMNIISSVIIFHGNSLDQCNQIFRYLMINCRFRDLLLNQFALASQLAHQLVYYLKYRCHDIYTIFLKFDVQIETFIAGWLIPLMGNIVPLQNMHLVINIFIEKGWIGIIKIIMAMLLYLKNKIIQAKDQSELMYLLSVQMLKNENINWEEVLKSSSNIKNLPTFLK